jgi:TolB-like protein
MLMNPAGAAVADAPVLAPSAHALLKSLARAPAEVPAPEVRVALARILAGVGFVKARRTSRLLQFLVEKRLANAVRDINEYTIGIEVFERDPATFSPGEDPVVRVQVGRLREKLKLYYASVAPRPEIVFAIPTGSYMPVIERSRGGAEPCEPGGLLAIMPLAWIADDDATVAACAAFTRGLGEELTHRLFQQFGSKVVAPSFSCARQPDAAAPAPGRLGHVLEGSVRVDGELIRLSIRLVGAGDGAIAWSQQFDRGRAFTIAAQEELGYFVCAAVKRHFCRD